MQFNKIRAAAVAGVGAGAAAMALSGAGAASAAGFGINGNDVGSVDTSQSGNSEGKNTTIAVSLFNPSSATTSGNASGNTLIAIDGRAVAGGNATGNRTLTVAGETEFKGNSRNNYVFNGGSKVSVNGNADSVLSVDLCGEELAGEADHVTVEDACG